jgi:hypothetical protein
MKWSCLAQRDEFVLSFNAEKPMSKAVAVKINLSFVRVVGLVGG